MSYITPEFKSFYDAEYFLKYRAGELQNEYEKFQEIKNKYSKKFGSVVK